MALPAPLDLVPLLLPGAVTTLKITAMAGASGLVLAFPAGLARLAPWWPLRVVATSYVEIFRGTSALVQLYFFFYVLPLFGILLSPIVAGVAALSLNFGAYGSEIVRAGMLSVDPGQREATIALNMTPMLSFRRIILPQAILLMLPPFGTLAIELLKFSSLVSLITITDLSFTGNIVFQTVGRRQEIYTTVLLMYFAMAFMITLLTRGFERRLGFFKQSGRP